MKRRSVLVEERGERCGAVSMCVEMSHEDGKWAAAAGVRWKLAYRVDTAAWLGADGGEGGG